MVDIMSYVYGLGVAYAESEMGVPLHEWQKEQQACHLVFRILKFSCDSKLSQGREPMV
jgi:hypothetical protein